MTRVITLACLSGPRVKEGGRSSELCWQQPREYWRILNLARRRTLRLGLPDACKSLISHPIDGGWRPLVLFSALYRRWPNARRATIEPWTKEHLAPFFACGSGRSAEHAVWRQAIKA